MAYATRAAARVAAYLQWVSEAHFRLIHNDDGTWDYAESTPEASERSNPTFEFFNEADVRGAQLMRLYKAAVNFGMEMVDVCAMKREALVEFVLKNLRESSYPLDRETPAEVKVPRQRKSSRRPRETKADGSITRPEKAGPVKQVWDICDKLGPDAARKDIIAACVKAGVNKSTASVQFGKWKSFRAAQNAAAPTPAPTHVSKKAAESDDVPAPRKVSRKRTGAK